MTMYSLLQSVKVYCVLVTHTPSVGSGRWEKGGVQMMKKEISADGSKVTIYCNATHLTSFAVLVDVSGTLNPGVSLCVCVCVCA